MATRSPAIEAMPPISGGPDRNPTNPTVATVAIPLATEVPVRAAAL